MKLKLAPFLIFLLTAVCAAQLFLLSTPGPVTALPPRPTATAVPAPKPQIPGAQIALQLEGEVPNGIWTVVQWQDAQDSWHDVTGWQGTPDENHTVVWWVGAENLGTGPFRWLILQDDEILGTSESFNLPLYPYTISTITMNVP